jgi:hypothetical protein
MIGPRDRDHRQQWRDECQHQSGDDEIEGPLDRELRAVEGGWAQREQRQ